MRWISLHHYRKVVESYTWSGVQVEVVLWLDNPKARNAMSIAMMHAEPIVNEAEEKLFRVLL